MHFSHFAAAGNTKNWFGDLIKAPPMSMAPPLPTSLTGEDLFASWKRNLESQHGFLNNSHLHNSPLPPLSSAPPMTLGSPFLTSTFAKCGNSPITSVLPAQKPPTPSPHSPTSSTPDKAGGGADTPQTARTPPITQRPPSSTPVTNGSSRHSSEDGHQSPARFDMKSPFRAEDMLPLPPALMRTPTFMGAGGRIPKFDPMEGHLQDMLRYNMEKYAGRALDTLGMARRVRELLSIHNIGQRLFAKYVLGLSQGTVSELLSKPKCWEKLTEKGRDSYRKMHAWCYDENAVLLLKTLIPRKGELSASRGPPNIPPRPPFPQSHLPSHLPLPSMQLPPRPTIFREKEEPINIDRFPGMPPQRMLFPHLDKVTIYKSPTCSSASQMSIFNYPVQKPEAPKSKSPNPPESEPSTSPPKQRGGEDGMKDALQRYVHEII
jgi:hypothetical protein